MDCSHVPSWSRCLVEVLRWWRYLDARKSSFATSEAVRVIDSKFVIGQTRESLSAECFIQLRQYAASDSRSLVHAFVVRRVDYCLGLLDDASRKMTDKLLRVFDAAA